MEKTEYIVQVFGAIKAVDTVKRWYDLDNNGNDRAGALESFKNFKDGALSKVRLIERVTTEKRLR